MPRDPQERERKPKKKAPTAAPTPVSVQPAPGGPYDVPMYTPQILPGYQAPMPAVQPNVFAPPAGFRDKLAWMHQNNIGWDKEKGFFFNPAPNITAAPAMNEMEIPSKKQKNPGMAAEPPKDKNKRQPKKKDKIDIFNPMG